MDQSNSIWDVGEIDPSAYYRKFFGFDPARERIFLPKGYKYEIFFPLERDPELYHAGVIIGARVEVTGSESSPLIHNRIVFQRGKLEACVKCVHTAICTRPLIEALDAGEDKIIEWAQSTETRSWDSVNLPPEEHFISLKSYVEGLATMGIRQVIGIAYYNQKMFPETLPFGFNGMMQRQIIQALREVAPSATQAIIREFIIELAEGVPPDWFNLRLPIIDEIYDIKDILLGDPRVFEIIDSCTRSLNLRVLAVSHPRTHPDIIKTIEQDPCYPEYKAKAALKEQWRKKTPEYYFKIVIAGGSNQTRNVICNNLYENRFSGDTQLTVGVSIGIRNILVQEAIHTRLIFYNLTNDPRFRFLMPEFCRGAKAAIICYDVTDHHSFFEDVPLWLQIVRQENRTNLQVFLLGYNYNRPPAEHEITVESAENYAREWGCTQNIMLPLNPGRNVEEIILHIVERTIASLQQE